jgi:hypothetical protein
LNEGVRFPNASAAFAAIVAHHSPALSFAGLAETRTPHPTDSHPPLATRLDALHTPLDRISDAARVVSPSVPAISLVGRFELREQELTAVYQRLLATPPVEEIEPAASEAGTDPRSACRNCGLMYDESDYRPEAAVIYCSGCKKPLPRSGSSEQPAD